MELTVNSFMTFTSSSFYWWNILCFAEPSLFPTKPSEENASFSFQKFAVQCQDVTLQWQCVCCSFLVGSLIQSQLDLRATNVLFYIMQQVFPNDLIGQGIYSVLKTHHSSVKMLIHCIHGNCSLVAWLPELEYERVIYFVVLVLKKTQKKMMCVIIRGSAQSAAHVTVFLLLGRPHEVPSQWRSHLQKEF